MAQIEPEALWHLTLQRERVPRLLADLKVASDDLSYSLRIAWRLQPDGINRDLRFRLDDGSGAIVTQKRSHAGVHPQRLTSYDGRTRQFRSTVWYESAALSFPAVRLGDLLQPHPDDYDVTDTPPVPEQTQRVLDLRARGDHGKALIHVSIDPAKPVRTRTQSEVAGTRELTYTGWTTVGECLLATEWTVEEGYGIVWRVTLANVDTTSPLPNDLFRQSALDRPF